MADVQGSQSNSYQSMIQLLQGLHQVLNKTTMSDDDTKIINDSLRGVEEFGIFLNTVESERNNYKLLYEDLAKSCAIHSKLQSEKETIEAQLTEQIEKYNKGESDWNSTKEQLLSAQEKLSKIDEECKKCNELKEECVTALSNMTTEKSDLNKKVKQLEEQLSEKNEEIRIKDETLNALLSSGVAPKQTEVVDLEVLKADVTSSDDSKKSTESVLESKEPEDITLKTYYQKYPNLAPIETLHNAGILQYSPDDESFWRPDVKQVYCTQFTKEDICNSKKCCTYKGKKCIKDKTDCPKQNFQPLKPFKPSKN
jgi:chromosome segregation ATPase